MIDQRLRHRPNDALRHDARTGNLEKGASRHSMRARYLMRAGDVKRHGIRSPTGEPLRGLDSSGSSCSSRSKRLERLELLERMEPPQQIDCTLGRAWPDGRQ